MPRFLVSLALTLTALVGFSPVALASPVTFNFAGTWTSGSPGAATFSGWVTYETIQVDACSIDTTAGCYRLTDLSVTIGNTIVSGSDGYFDVSAGAGSSDFINLYSDVLRSGLSGSVQVYFDYGPGAFANDALPGTIPQNWGMSGVAVSAYAPLTNVTFLGYGNVTSMTPVPEPGSLVLVGIGLAAWRVRRSVRRRT